MFTGAVHDQPEPEPEPGLCRTQTRERLERLCSDPRTRAIFRPFEESNFFHHVLGRCQPEYAAASPETKARLLQASLGALAISMGSSSPHAVPATELKRVRALQLMEQLSEPDQQAMLLWTMDTRLNLPEIFNAANRGLLCDDPATMRDLGYFLCALIHFIATHPPAEAVTLYRGTSITPMQKVPVQLDSGDAGRVFRQPIFAAASTDAAIVAEFCEGEDAPVMEFRVPAGCNRCARVPSELSA
jgi:hypothetical protein